MPITTVAEFHAQFASLLPELTTNKKKPKPMPASKVDSLCMVPRYRTGEGTEAIPKSLEAILRYDVNFSIQDSHEPLLETLLASIGKDGRFTSALPDPYVAGLLGREVKKLPAGTPLWVRDKMPALLEIDHSGDQKVFIYVSNIDKHGEFPIARYADEPSVWITEVSLAHYILDATDSESAVIKEIKRTLSFDKELAAIEKRHARITKREGFDKNPALDKLLRSFAGE